MKIFSFTMILLIGLCSFSCFYSYAQDGIEKDENKVKHTGKVGKPNAIFFAPLNLFDFQNPNFQIGYERFVAEKWTLQIDGAIMIPHSILQYITDLTDGLKNCPYTNKGFRIKVSAKYMLINKRIVKLYISPELFYYRNKSGIARYLSISDPNFKYSFEILEGISSYLQFFYNDEEKMGVNSKIGAKFHFGKYFFIEPHVGLGFAYRNVIQTGKENPNDKVSGGLSSYSPEGINHDYSSLWIFDKAAPDKWVPTIPFNLKIGLRF